MISRNALRQAIATGQARDVKALLDDHEALQVLKTYLQIPDDQLRAHLRRLVDEVSQSSGTNLDSGYLTDRSSTSKISV